MARSSSSRRFENEGALALAGGHVTPPAIATAFASFACDSESLQTVSSLTHLLSTGAARAVV